eukprot:PhM_4_TR3412/c3_g1_i1/m.82367
MKIQRGRTITLCAFGTIRFLPICIFACTDHHPSKPRIKDETLTTSNVRPTYSKEEEEANTAVIITPTRVPLAPIPNNQPMANARFRTVKKQHTAAKWQVKPQNIPKYISARNAAGL